MTQLKDRIAEQADLPQPEMNTYSLDYVEGNKKVIVNDHTLFKLLNG